MPLKKCQIDGKSGWKWGSEGKCYSGPEAKKKAIAQGIAIEGGDISKFAEPERVSVDYDDTASTARGKELIRRLIREGKLVYIISARSVRFPIINNLDGLIPDSRIWAVGSNRNKIEKIKDLRIDRHIDNNKDVIDQLKELNIKGELF